MNIKGKLLVMGLAATTLFSTISVSAATWTTTQVSGSYYKSGLLNYGDGTRYLHSRGISGKGTIQMNKVNSYAPDTVVAVVNTKPAVNVKDVWASKSKTSNGTKQSYYYTWISTSSSAASHLRVSDY